MNDQPKKLLGEVISRVTMAVLGLALLFGGYKCLRVAYRIWEEYQQSHLDQVYTVHSNNGSGAGVIALIGVVLVLLGGFFAFAAIVPVQVLADRFKPRAPSAFDGAETGQSSSTSNTIRFFTRW